ncbi:MAG: class I SAM-dependent methyltransferase, partial [Planctomycetota bacterium]|nr:class I SAM-dependent methyltransferase [Planctomycetota bacterium]
MSSQQPPAISLLRKLRQEVGVTRAALLSQQVDLRKRAREKFVDADKMLFTDRGLQQATDERVAAHKAARFETLDRVADLC